jgi:spore coat polysaccharide biosynthesis protein SpsF (cytidylyltransferase family)
LRRAGATPGRTGLLRQNSRIYRLLSLEAPVELARLEVRLDVEGLADLPRIEAMSAHFAGRTDFGSAEILSFLEFFRVVSPRQSWTLKRSRGRAASAFGR